MFLLPTFLEVGGEPFGIRNDGDFRMVLDCFSALQDPALESRERILAALIIFFDGMEDEADLKERFGEHMEEAVSGMYRFFNCGQEETAGSRSNLKLIDWEQDEQLIASAVNGAAGKEIRAESYVHWWTFMGWYTAAGECPLSHIVSIRYKIAKHEKLEKHEQKFKQENPQYFLWKQNSVGSREAQDLLRELWNQE